LGAVDEEGMNVVYPALKKTHAYYARSMTLEKWCEQHFSLSLYHALSHTHLLSPHTQSACF
jgi:hypothetical protein